MSTTAVEMCVTAAMKASTMEAATVKAAAMSSAMTASTMTAATTMTATARKGRARRCNHHGNGNCHDEPEHWHPPTDVRETRNVY